MNSTDFRRREGKGIVYYTCTSFEAVPGLRHGFSTRLGPDGDLNLTPHSGIPLERVQEHRDRFLEALGMAGDRLTTLSQMHSDRLHFVDANTGELDPKPAGDALATLQTGIALAVQVADCFPVLLIDRSSGSIAAVHSGWRGTASRILFKTISAMRSNLGAEPASMMAAIGPGIRRCCMEVGSEVASLFEKEYPGRKIAARHGNKNKSLLNIPEALTIQCDEGSIPRENIYDVGLCTRCRQDEFFSFRAQGAAAGRMMAVISRGS